MLVLPVGVPRALLWCDRLHAGRRFRRSRGAAPPHDAARHRDHPGGDPMTLTRARIRGTVGESVERPDGAPKVKGEFRYASDLWERGMLHGATRRSPHALPIHDRGNVIDAVHLVHGDPKAKADVEVTGEYELGMQDQAALGPEAGLAIPDTDGGVTLHIATQWLHEDLRQIAPCLGLP